MDTPPHSKSPLAPSPITDSSTLNDTSSFLAVKATSADTYDHGPRLSEGDYIQLADLPLSNIDPNYPKLLLIMSSVVMMIIITALTVLLLIINPLPLIIATGFIALTILVAALVIKLIHLKANKIAYGLFKHEMVLREGLFWVSTTALPYTRLQHVNLSQGPAERRFNLVTLKCFSAGSGLAEIDLPGLNADLAENLRQHLLSQAAASHQLPATKLNTREHSTSVDDPTPAIERSQQDSHNG
jgi:membrane protein YdbS with pleckstrin-like domain